ncbi:cystatin-POGU1-like [Megalops cyprinoides]|uniref:cystatin-POGU1-like n=1 Tax=Megalops cyprinoides TaxID=118141 RepID=UPI001864A5E1|nr:cystatin-POGU1-like [Megalops cyprinoides]
MARWSFCVCVLLAIVAYAYATGQIEDASTTSPEVKDAAKTALEMYNKRANDMYMYFLRNIVSAKKQVVAGLIFYLDLETVRCVKDQDMKACPETGDAQQTFLCHFEIWFKPGPARDAEILKSTCAASVSNSE